MFHYYLLVVLAVVQAGPAKENFKDQYCTDPRTMKKHAAYTEWADAYSCTRHRCQPGGRNLAIYTVGCKRVEAPESAIECEEVVEDTNMQFPFCCTRLRCLVVVRGEVWTRVLGQPWETLPAAPWSHMYKMKKPPPGDTSFLPKISNEGPVYELATDGETEKVLRTNKKATTEGPDCKDGVPRAVPAPDIVIALSTGSEIKEKKSENVMRASSIGSASNQYSSISREQDKDKGLKERKDNRNRTKRGRKLQPVPVYEEETPEHRNEVDVEDPMVEKEKQLNEPTSEEKYSLNFFTTLKPKIHPSSWTEIPLSSWNEHDIPLGETETNVREPSRVPEVEERKEKPANLQALVDAIGTRMRDIETVVQKMSEKVQQVKHQDSAEKRIKDSDSILPRLSEKQPIKELDSAEKRIQMEELTTVKHRQPLSKDKEMKTKRPNPDGEHYKRFSVRNRSKYLHTTESTSEQPLFVEDTGMNGYFSDASNTVLRRANAQGPVAATYMAPVENHHKPAHILPEASEESEKKHKKHSHKRKRNKNRSHKKHHKEEKKKKAKVSGEVGDNVVSLEDSSAIATK